MSAAKYTPGPWAWSDGGHYLMPVTPRPDVSAVHTILGPDGCHGYLAKPLSEVFAEDAANRALIAAAADLLEALQAEPEWRERDAVGAIDPEWDYERMVGAKRRAAIAKATCASDSGEVAP